MKIFIIPIAAQISAVGMRRKKPPVNIRHIMNNGTAKTISIVAMIFVIPQVILKARLAAFISRNIAITDKIISVNLISPLSFS